MPLTMLREAVRLRHSTLRQTRLPERVMGSPVATCTGKQDRKWLRCQREIVRTAALAYSGASKEESWIWLFLRRTCHGPASASLELSIPGGGCRALGGSSVSFCAWCKHPGICACRACVSTAIAARLAQHHTSV